MAKVIVGLQYGYEGKGRFAHFCSEDADYIVRATGGDNAEYTVDVNGVKYAMHLLPSGIVRDDVKSVIASGTVCNPIALIEEIREMQKLGVKITPEKLFISKRAHVIMQYHIDMDLLWEEVTEIKNDVSTSGYGIASCYQDKVGLIGIRMEDLALPIEKLADKIQKAVLFKNVLFQKFEKDDAIVNPTELAEKCKEYFEFLEPYITETDEMLQKATVSCEKIVIEDAQAFKLDVDYGDYPNVSSSNTTAAGVISGAGMGPIYLMSVCGVMKAYTSKNGEEAFPTMQNNNIGELIRELGDEYETVTGNPRKTGWLDLVEIKKAVMANTVTAICINHLDIIGKVGEKLGYIKIRIGDTPGGNPKYYKIKGGWEIENAKTFKDLPDLARQFVLFIERYLGVHIQYIGVGPEKKDMIIRL